MISVALATAFLKMRLRCLVRKDRKPRLGVLLMCLIAPQKPVLGSDLVPLTWLPELVAFPMCLQELSGASLEIKRTSFASCRFFPPSSG